MTEERFLISGGTGCIGSWVVRGLVREGAPVTVVTTGRRRDRLELILTPVELAAVEILEADVNDLETIEAAARRAGVTAVVHLAALQLPFCAADPVAGARVNVQGTASAFELGDRILPFPAAFEGAPLETALGAQPVTPLADGVRQTIKTYRAALRDGRLGDAFLDRVLAS